MTRDNNNPGDVRSFELGNHFLLRTELKVLSLHTRTWLHGRIKDSQEIARVKQSEDTGHACGGWGENVPTSLCTEHLVSNGGAVRGDLENMSLGKGFES